MYCLECQELINRNITYQNIYKVNIHKICNSCFSKHLFIQKNAVVPIKNGVIEVNILFDNIINPLALMSFIKPYYVYYLYNKPQTLFIYVDYFEASIVQLLDKLEFGNIFLVSLENKMSKEKDYED